MNVIEKEDVWDTKNAFRNQVNFLILRENFKTETMEELETAVIMYVKEWIALVNPKPQYVDGPWKAYVKRFSGMNTATTDIMKKLKNEELIKTSTLKQAFENLQN